MNLLLVIIATLSLSPDQRVADDLGLVFTQASVLRQSVYGGILGDVYAHSNVAESWGEFGTLVHEGTHGANSVVRNRYGGWDICNAMYVCGNVAIIIREPAVPLTTVRQFIPTNMRGISYDLYFVQRATSWNNQTLYIFDEWSAYTNAAWYGEESNSLRYSDALQATEFAVYAICIVEATATTKPRYDRTQLVAAVAWMCRRRILPLLQEPGTERARAWWEKFRQSETTADLRASVRIRLDETSARLILEG